MFGDFRFSWINERAKTEGESRLGWGWGGGGRVFAPTPSIKRKIVKIKIFESKKNEVDDKELLYIMKIFGK